VVSEICRIAALLHQGYVKRAQFSAHSRLCSATLVERRSGSWGKAVIVAGLQPTPQAEMTRKRRIPEEDVHRIVYDVYRKLGRAPTNSEFERLSNHSIALLRRRGLSLARAVTEAINRFGDQRDEHVIEPTRVVLMPINGERSDKRKQCYGEYIDFRAMPHAPMNECGVLIIFGMLAADLGYKILFVQDRFPDCIALRTRPDKKCELARIEFEYLSSRFRDQGHLASECDVIVCWRHDWPDCPVEVVELQSVVQRITNERRHNRGAA
jgi:hypothetical protein